MQQEKNGECYMGWRVGENQGTAHFLGMFGLLPLGKGCRILLGILELLHQVGLLFVQSLDLQYLNHMVRIAIIQILRQESFGLWQFQVTIFFIVQQASLIVYQLSK